MAKRWIVTKNTKRDIKGIDVDGKKRKFNAGTDSFVLSDGGEADEVSKTVGMKGGTGEVVVSEFDSWKSKDELSGHSYKFSTPRGNWKSRIDWSD